jgi:hypothetical protein
MDRSLRAMSGLVCLLCHNSQEIGIRIGGEKWEKERKKSKAKISIVPALIWEYKIKYIERKR